MEYKLTRYEKILNKDETIKEIFIAVKFTKNEDVWEQGYWLNELEKNTLLNDESYISILISKVISIGESALERYKATPPEQILEEPEL